MREARLFTSALVFGITLTGTAALWAGSQDGEGGTTFDGPYKVVDSININPNNSHMRLEVYIPAGEPSHGFDSLLTRDDLLHPHDWDHKADGTLYAGPAERIIIRPKGGNRARELKNRLSDNEGWDVISIPGGNTYRLVASNGSTPVRVFNSHDNKNGAMGHWYLGFGGGTGDSDSSSDGSSDPDLSDAEYTRVVYGINRENGALRRYNFSPAEGESAAKGIGNVHTSDGSVLRGIDAGAFLPGLRNMFAFHKPDGAKQTRLTYVSLDHADKGQAGYVGQPMGTAAVTGATMVGSELYAIQSPPKINFDLQGKSLITREKAAAKVEVLGAAITSNGKDVPVSVQIDAGGTMHEPFGDFSNVRAGDINDRKNPRTYTLPDKLPSGSTINVTAQSWLYGWHKENGDWKKGWHEYLQVNSASDPDHLIVLRDGDTVPDIEPLRDQGSVASFVSAYVNEERGTVSLQKNQAIYLFELGSSDLSTTAADFQDLVLLVTLSPDRESLEQNDTDVAAPPRLVRVDTKTAKVEEVVMPLRVGYESLAYDSSESVFYATHNDTVYEIDPAGSSEEHYESFDGAAMRAMAFAGWKLSSFEEAQNQKLWPVNPDVLQAVGGAKDIQMNNLGTMIFAKPEQLPSHDPEAYD